MVRDLGQQPTTWMGTGCSSTGGNQQRSQQCAEQVLQPGNKTARCGRTEKKKKGMEGGQGPHLHEQDFGRTIRDTGEREWGAHRDTEGGWAGFTHTTGSQGFLSRIGQVAPGGTGAGAGLLLVALS